MFSDTLDSLEFSQTNDLSSAARDQMNYSNGTLIVYCVVFCLYSCTCFRLVRKVVRSSRKYELYFCVLASFIGAAINVFVLAFYFVFNTSCTFRSILVTVTSGLISNLVQVAIYAWIYRVLKYKAILILGTLISVIKFMPLVYSLLNVSYYARVVGLCTFRNGPRLLYYSVVFDMAITIFFIMCFLFALFYHRRLLKQKEPKFSTIPADVTFKIQNLYAGIKRVLLALFINCILMIFIMVLIALYPGGRLAIVFFHLSLGITCKLIADALFLILRPFDIPVVDSLDHIPCLDMAEEYISK